MKPKEAQRLIRLKATLEKDLNDLSQLQKEWRGYDGTESSVIDEAKHILQWTQKR